jgi:hypothetical protein
VVTAKITDVILCSLVVIHQCFGEMYGFCLHFLILTLKMEAECTSETSVSIIRQHDITSQKTIILIDVCDISETQMIIIFC